ncbi:MAG: hypothetical protein U0586_14700 [Candidatus Brocadiaceae bacterium]
MIISKKRGIFCILLLFLTTVFAGCAHVYKCPTQPIQLNQQIDKIPLNIELVQSNELRTAQWEKHSMGDVFRIPLGDAFLLNTESVAQKLFSSVIVTQSKSGRNNAGVEAILIPRMVLADRTFGVTAFGDSILTFMLEWKMEDLNGNTIWVDTIKREGKEKTGNVFTNTSNAKKQIETCLTELFQKSFQTISSSPEIREFARKTGKF